MSYSNRPNSFLSHLTQREYRFTDRESKTAALAQLLLDDQGVRAAGQKRAEQSGLKRPLSDREIATGNWITDPTIDRRPTIERIADQVSQRGARHNAYTVALDEIRRTMSMLDAWRN